MSVCSVENHMESNNSSSKFQQQPNATWRRTQLFKNFYVSCSLEKNEKQNGVVCELMARNRKWVSTTCTYRTSELFLSRLLRFTIWTTRSQRVNTPRFNIWLCCTADPRQDACQKVEYPFEELCTSRDTRALRADIYPESWRYKKSPVSLELQSRSY